VKFAKFKFPFVPDTLTNVDRLVSGVCRGTRDCPPACQHHSQYLRLQRAVPYPGDHQRNAVWFLVHFPGRYRFRTYYKI
jgi:hypothetical protein